MSEQNGLSPSVARHVEDLYGPPSDPSVVGMLGRMAIFMYLYSPELSFADSVNFVIGSMRNDGRLKNHLDERRARYCFKSLFVHEEWFRALILEEGAQIFKKRPEGQGVTDHQINRRLVQMRVEFDKHGLKF